MNITNIVLAILIEKPQTRNSDYWLWREVIKAMGAGEILKDWTVEQFLTDGFNKVPHFETVGRARRKLQAKYPELKGSPVVQEGRDEREKQYREYAKI